jgi:hypothetical protein
LHWIVGCSELPNSDAGDELPGGFVMLDGSVKALAGGQHPRVDSGLTGRMKGDLNLIQLPGRLPTKLLRGIDVSA